MASYTQLCVHLIFGLKKRQKFIPEDIYEYMGGIINKIGGKSIIIGGTNDHVHILLFMPKDKSISELVRTVKNNSSKWHNQKSMGRMYWQEGYAAYSVSKSIIPRVVSYIRNQKEHHKLRSFADEMRDFIDDKDVLKIWENWFAKQECEE